MTFKRTKAPAEIKDFGIDWTAELIVSNPADLISSSTWTVEDNTPDDLTLGIDYIEGSIAFVRTSAGGRLEQKHKLVNRIVTASGQTWQRTIQVTMRNY